MKAKEKSRAVKIALLATVLVLLAAYIGIAVYYRMHFYPNTMVGELNVSGMTPAEVEKEIAGEVDDYRLVLQEREEKEEEITGQSIGLVPDHGMAIEDALAAQSGFGWIKHVFTHSEIERQPVNYDEDQLNRRVQELSCMQAENQVSPEDAHLSYENGSFRIVPEVYGTTIKAEAIKNSIEQAILNLDESLDLEEAGCYEEPTVLDGDEKLKMALDQANVCVKADITYQAGEKTLHCGADEISKMLSFAEDGSVSLDQEALSSFITGLDQTFSTLGKEKKFKTSYGKTISISRSDYGWKVDTQAETEALQEAILSGTVETREPAFSQKAAGFGTYDYGNRYVEINLTAQHLFLYVNGKKVLETDFVSGNESNGNATRLGMMRLKYKQKDAVLRGDDYETPVSYWMPFDGNIGMHDATWRSKFGGEIYKTAGSHGCVNLPLSAAKTIFENIQAGDPVIVYKLKGTEPEIEKKEEDSKDKKKDSDKKKDKTDSDKNDKSQSGSGDENQSSDSNKQN